MNVFRDAHGDASDAPIQPPFVTPMTVGYLSETRDSHLTAAVASRLTPSSSAVVLSGERQGFLCSKLPWML
jgi:hypothetical protein